MRALYEVRRDTRKERELVNPHNRVWRMGDPALASLRAYRTYHPSIRVYVVERNGRTVWLTWKQFTILQFIDQSRNRRKRLRLQDIAKACQCSAATVSRTLVKFDLWRFIDYVALTGRLGGSWVYTRVHRDEEAEANRAGAKHTLESRKAARSWLAQQVRLYQWRLRAEWKRRVRVHRYAPVTTGSMDAMNL